MEKSEIDVSIIYKYEDFPDTRSGRCDKCDGVKFKSSVGNGQFIRECVKCGLKKSI
ncbi:hypothetical protein MKX58_27950 [Priestia sp. FSL R5-0680]|uniref:hypothetical protein n=1 Tax=Priestia sp. FSL R5-0680 TaxID=2921582 RepID=UPI0030FB1BD2